WHMADKDRIRHTCRKNLWQSRRTRATPPPLRIQHEISRPHDQERIHNLGNITRRHARGVDRVTRPSVLRRLPVSSRISKQTEQTTSPFQGIYSGLPRPSSGWCAARRNRSI